MMRLTLKMLGHRQHHGLLIIYIHVIDFLFKVELKLKTQPNTLKIEIDLSI